MWAGFGTLVLLEIILGVDNLVFIAILADKLPPHQRDKARVIGLILALLMRVVLLLSISWMVTLTAPLFAVMGMEFSGRDLILLGGGLFLLMKATSEIHGRLEGFGHGNRNVSVVPSFGVVVAQIVVLDAVFSLDAVITAVGMTHDVGMMICAVTVAIGIMIVASKPLTRFVNAHPTVIMLCLGFLLLVGFSLVAEGMGAHIPKGYLYAAIGFSLLIEAFNQTALAKHRRRLADTTDYRQKTTDAVLRLLTGKGAAGHDDDGVSEMDMISLMKNNPNTDIFKPEEEKMIRSILALTNRDARSVMTPRPDLHWIDLDDAPDAILAEIESSPYSRIIATRGDIDNVVGIIDKDDLLSAYIRDGVPHIDRTLHAPLTVHETTDILRLLELFKEHPKDIVLVVDEYGATQGVITHMDILEAIAGEIPGLEDMASAPSYTETAKGYMIDGLTPVEDVQELLNLPDLPDGDYATVAGLVLSQASHVPDIGHTMTIGDWTLTVVEMDARRIKTVEAVPTGPSH